MEETHLHRYDHLSQKRENHHYNFQACVIISIHYAQFLPPTWCPHRPCIWANPTDLSTLFSQQRHQQGTHPLLHAPPNLLIFIKQDTTPLQEKYQQCHIYLSQTQEQRDAIKKAKNGKLDKQIFLHLPYHPQNPSSGFIQNLWQNLVFLPPGQENLNQLTNWEGHHVPIKRLIVAYHCNPNLANLNSYRKLTSHTGLKPLAFII
jgi:hypothetical protein